MQLRQQISEADLELRCNIQDGALCDNILDVAAVQDPPLNTILTVKFVFYRELLSKIWVPNERTMTENTLKQLLLY